MNVAKISYTLALAEISFDNIKVLVGEHFPATVGAFAFLPVPDGLVFLPADLLDISSVLESKKIFFIQIRVHGNPAGRMLRDVKRREPEDFNRWVSG